jgi:hypothetical protein
VSGGFEEMGACDGDNGDRFGSIGRDRFHPDDYRERSGQVQDAAKKTGILLAIAVRTRCGLKLKTAIVGNRPSFGS